MTDINKLNKQAQRGERAKQLFNDELMQEFFKNVEDMLFLKFKEADISDAEGLKNCKIALKILGNIKSQFIPIIANGEAAKKEILSLKEPSKIRKVIGF